MKISCFSVESAFRFKVGFITVVYILILSLLIGFRSADVGTDTQRYVNHYLRGSDGDYYGRFDLVFSFLLNFFSSSGIPVEIFLSFVAFVVAASYYSIFFKVIASQVNESSGTTKIITLLLFYSSFLLLSSWFFSSSTNGLRQGMSLAVLLVAVGFLLKEGIGIKFFVIYVLSVGLHSSTILILPFIFLYLVSYGILLLVWMGAGIG